MNEADIQKLLELISETSKEGEEKLLAAETQASLELRKGEYLTRRMSELSAQMRLVPGPHKKAIGQALNVAKEALNNALDKRLLALQKEKLQLELKARAVDVTLPGKRPQLGHLHPIRQVQHELVSIFQKLGYAVAEGPEVETDWHNFEALNFPKDHPARDMQDSFFLWENLLLRTHTSPVQIRAMLGQKPPVQVVMPGAVYRCDSDITHSPMFHQLEILCVDEGITFADLKGTLLTFVELVYGKGTKIRMRPSFFPFTEPSAEVDVSCVFCKAAGCRVCKFSGWIEILGAGMVDPNVLHNCGYDSERYTGFAAGLGIERIAMLKYGINDIRLLFENDMRFLEQF